MPSRWIKPPQEPSWSGPDPDPLQARARQQRCAHLAAQLADLRRALLDNDLAQLQPTRSAWPPPLSRVQETRFTQLQANEGRVRAGKPLHPAEERWGEAELLAELAFCRSLRDAIERSAIRDHCHVCAWGGTVYARPLAALWRRREALIECRTCHKRVCLRCSTDEQCRSCQHAAQGLLGRLRH